MAITVEKTVYEPWGSCIRVSNGTVEFFATVDIGPHIIRLGINGKHNIFFEDKQDIINVDLSEYSYEGDKWHIYGGHRLWVSPESYHSYYPEIHPVDYTLLKNGVILRQKVQEFNNLAFEIEATMSDDGTITVNHKITNVGAWKIELAPWALSVLAPGGVEVVPQPDRSTGLLANRVISLWDYSNMNDERVTWGKDFIILRQDENATTNFKLGINNEKGYAAYFLKGCLFVKKYTPVINGNYPDYGTSFETFTRECMLEMETLGELQAIAPGESVCHTETWNVYDNVELPELTDEKISETMKKYI